MRQEGAGAFPKTAAGAVADDGIADFLGGGEAGPGGRAGFRPAAGLDDHQLAPFGYSVRDIKEFAPDAQAFQGDRVGIAVSRQGAGFAARDQAESRLRPLERRRARIFWPFFVAMRERKPWRRLRFRLLGWKVRLVATGHAP